MHLNKIIMLNCLFLIITSFSLLAFADNTDELHVRLRIDGAAFISPVSSIESEGSESTKSSSFCVFSNNHRKYWISFGSNNSNGNNFFAKPIGAHAKQEHASIYQVQFRPSVSGAAFQQVKPGVDYGPYIGSDNFSECIENPILRNATIKLNFEKMPNSGIYTNDLNIRVEEFEGE